MTTSLFQSLIKIVQALKKFETTISLEIKNSETLIAFMYWAFFSFIISFLHWINSGYTGQYSPLPCWPHFPDCKNILPLTPLPFGYSETIFYTLLLSVIAYGLYNLYKKNFITAYYCIAILWLWKAFVISVTYGISNFDYYDLVLIGVFLFLPNKKLYLKFFFVLLYFLASTLKIGTGWIDGAYFTSLQLGLPMVTNNLAPIATTIVILMQMVASWFLLSKHKYLYAFSFWFFIFFHLYSTILVGYRYPLTALFCLIVLFGLEKGATSLKEIRITFKTLPHFLVIFSLFALQGVGLYIPGNQKITLEGNNYGLYMFEANHQCISSYSIKEKTGKETSYVTSSADARYRCDPYTTMLRLQKKCTPDIATISWTFDHSINGEPLYKIVDIKNVCGLEYKPFTHNTWINIQNPPYVADVHKNIYDLQKSNQNMDIFEKTIAGKTYKGNTILEHNNSIEKTKLQKIIGEHSEKIILAYWMIWFTTLITIIFIIISNSRRKLS